jgi:hypothetical protein
MLTTSSQTLHTLYTPVTTAGSGFWDVGERKFRALSVSVWGEFQECGRLRPPDDDDDLRQAGKTLATHWEGPCTCFGRGLSRPYSRASARPAPLP